ncbi:MAG: 3-oxoadipyl-CoA thiolase [Bacteroidetes bacterium]|nr:3-oxoadipyl-CoA thiolase [Bacteroidota bacterium]
MKNEVYIVDGVRTAIGKYGGALSSVRADDLASFVIRKLIEKNKNIDSSEISDVIFGCANQSGEDNRNIARMALLLAGLPQTVPGVTINRLCASGMNAVSIAANSISSGNGDLFIAGGVENMSRSPWVIAKSGETFSRTPEIFDTTIGWRFVNPKMKEIYGIDSMGQTAENVAEYLKISRKLQDEFAFNSQQKAIKSIKSGRFKKEITSIEILKGKEKIIFETDEYPRFETSLEKLATLKPAFKKDGTVTAGNSSGINDGACAILLASENAIKKYNLKPIAKFISTAVCGVEPRLMGLGPVSSTKKVLQNSSLELNKINIIEINEAFSAQVLGCLQELKIDINDERVNPNGGAIALGHPLGMSGARLILTAALELQEKNKNYALCTMCVGVGQGMSTIIERI